VLNHEKGVLNSEHSYWNLIKGIILVKCKPFLIIWLHQKLLNDF